MTNPIPYVPGYDFSDYQEANPTLPLPGTRIDTEFNNLQITTNSIIGKLADVRRSDGALVNDIVTLDSLSDEVKQMFGVYGVEVDVDEVLAWIDEAGGEELAAIEAAGVDERAAMSVHEANLEALLTVAGLADAANVGETQADARALVVDDEPYYVLSASQGDGAMYPFIRRVGGIATDTPKTPIGSAYAAGIDGPFPALPPDYLHWTPRRVITDLSGYVTRLECDEGVLIAKNGGGFLPEQEISGSLPLPQYFDTQSVDGVLAGDSPQTISIAGLVRLDNNFLTASIDGIFGHSNITAPATGDDVVIAGSFVTTGRTWQVYANNRGAPFPPGTDLLIIWMGQSWTAGSDDSDPIRPALSLTQPAAFTDKVLMPTLGVRVPNFADGEIGTRPIRFSAYAQHVETTQTSVGGLGETPAASCARHLMRDIEINFGADHGVRIVSVNVAHGGYALESLGPGTPLFEDCLTAAVRDFVDTTRSQGRTPLVLSVCWTHGQGNQVSNATSAYYAMMYRSIRRRTIENIKRIVPGQYFDPSFVIDTVRTASSSRNSFDPIVKAQFLLGYEQGFVQAGEQYTTWGSIADGTGHPSPWAKTVIGQRHAKAILRTAPFGLGYSPLRPDLMRGTSAPAVRWTAANKFQVYFQRPLDRGTLAADTSGTYIGIGSTCNSTNWGFEYWDNSGGSDTAAPTVSITGCSIVEVDVIEFTLSDVPTGFDRKLLCAGRTDGAGDDALHGGGRCLVYLADGLAGGSSVDTAWHTSLYPIPVNEGGDGATFPVNKLWMQPFELPLGVSS